MSRAARFFLAALLVYKYLLLMSSLFPLSFFLKVTACFHHAVHGSALVVTLSGSILPDEHIASASLILRELEVVVDAHVEGDGFHV